MKTELRLLAAALLLLVLTAASCRNQAVAREPGGTAQPAGLQAGTASSSRFFAQRFTP